MPEGEPTLGGGPWWRPGELGRAACLGGPGTSWHRGRRWSEACPWLPEEPGMAQMLCLCMAVRMRRAARWCHSQCSLSISSGL